MLVEARRNLAWVCTLATKEAMFKIIAQLFDHQHIQLWPSILALDPQMHTRFI